VRGRGERASRPARPSDRVEAIPHREREVLAVVGIFQRLGVGSDDIYVQPVQVEDGAWVPAVVAKTSGPHWPTWVVSVFGTVPSIEAVEAEWTHAANAWNRLPACDRERLVEGSTSRLYVVNFITSCAARGITFPDDADASPPAAPGSGRLPS